MVTIMDAVNYSNFRKDLKTYFKQVNDDSEPLIVTNKNPEDNVVVLSKDEYDALIETLAIQSNKYLMDKINRGRKQVAKAQTNQHELIDPDGEVSDAKLD
ncbi:MAG: Hypothetical protein LKU_02109 [Lactobacillus kefiranofaciens]